MSIGLLQGVVSRVLRVDQESGLLGISE